MLNEATKLMNTRNKMINEAREVLRVLNAEKVDAATLVRPEIINTTSIIINKGKIVEVETIKEVEVVKTIEVADEEEMNRLYEEIQRHLGRIDQLVVENDELKDELKHKELLLNEFRDNMDEKIKTIHDLERQLRKIKAQMNKPVVEKKETSVVDDKYKDIPVPRIEDEDPEFANEDTITPIYTNFANINSDEIKKQYSYKSRLTMLEQQKAALEQAKARITKERESKIKYTQVKNVAGIVIKAYGQLTVNNKEYKFVASDQHVNPVVYGAMDMETIEAAKEIILASNALHKFVNPEVRNYNEEILYDFDNKIVIWRDTKEDIFKGYTDKYTFSWKYKEYDCPCGSQHRYFDFNKKQKSMNESRGTIAWEHAQRIMAACKALMNNNEESEQSDSSNNEILVNTNDDFIVYVPDNDPAARYYAERKAAEAAKKAEEERIANLTPEELQAIKEEEARKIAEMDDME